MGVGVVLVVVGGGGGKVFCYEVKWFGGDITLSYTSMHAVNVLQSLY